MRRHASLLIICLLLSSCTTYAPEELDRLTKEDANFKKMVLARDQAHREIQLIKDELLAKKRLLDAQVEKLRSEYDLYAKAQNIKIESYKKTIETNRGILRRGIDTAQAQLEAKTAELEGYDKTLTSVKKMLQESKKISLSSSERQKWDERILMLSEKIRPLQEEIQELKLEMRLKKQKIGFLN